MKRFNATPMGRFLGFAVAGVPPDVMGIGPVKAIPKVLAQAGLKQDALDWIELNEAFACVGIVSARKLGITEEVVNVNGGAIALGHPIGMSGARIVLSLALELKRRGGGIGAAALCGGGGQGDALLIRVP